MNMDVLKKTWATYDWNIHGSQSVSQARSQATWWQPPNLLK